MNQILKVQVKAPIQWQAFRTSRAWDIQKDPRSGSAHTELPHRIAESQSSQQGTAKLFHKRGKARGVAISDMLVSRVYRTLVTDLVILKKELRLGSLQGERFSMTWMPQL